MATPQRGDKSKQPHLHAAFAYEVHHLVQSGVERRALEGGGLALLEGLPEGALAEVFAHRLRLNPGAERLLQGLQRAGIRTMLVSGGFTYFTERLQRQLGFDYAWANQLEVIDGRLSGRVIGDIVDGDSKAAHLMRVRDELGLAPEQVIAAGDGANDLRMLRAAGFGVAFHAKPVLRDIAHCCLDHSGLDGILDLFG